MVGSLPAGANGTYAAMVEDLIIGDCAADDESGALYLDSPAFVVPAGAIPHVAFDHWVATEFGWDGGNLKVSVNGGAWTLVPPSQFEFNVYNDSLNSVGAGNTNPLEGQPAFTGTDGGSVGGSWGQSQVNLIGMALPGDSVKLRFDFGIDGCNGVVGWYVDDIEVYSCSEELPPVCGDGILDLGESCDDGNTANGDGCSDVCQVENGWTCEDPTPPSDGKNVIDDGSFEAGAFGGIWDEYSLNFGSPLCDVGSCGTGGGTGPSDGDWWAWFGGIPAAEEGSVSQDVTIPTTSTDLTFDLELPVCDSADDYLELWVDGNLEFSIDGGSSACGTVGYETQTVDLSSYADGASHTIEFYSEIFATNAGGSNFFVDDVYLSDNTDTEGSASVCTRPTKMYLPAIRSYASSVPDLPLLNGDFELGAVDWDEYSSHGWDLIFPSSVLPIAPKNGDWATWLGGGDDEVSYIEQTVKVPEGAPYLTYWHYIDSIDFECGWDFGGVGVGGNWFYQYDLCESENTSDWEKVVVDMSIYEGLLDRPRFCYHY